MSLVPIKMRLGQNGILARLPGVLQLHCIGGAAEDENGYVHVFQVDFHLSLPS